MESRTDLIFGEVVINQSSIQSQLLDLLYRKITILILMAWHSKASCKTNYYAKQGKCIDDLILPATSFPAPFPINLTVVKSLQKPLLWTRVQAPSVKPAAS